MNYRIVIFAPDEHIQYDARTPDREGVGGGIMARIRLAKALVDLGHQVSLVANCPQERTFDDVK